MSEFEFYIVAEDNNEEWIDNFNRFCGYKYKNGDKVEKKDYEKLSEDIDCFNREVAKGEAITLSKEWSE